MAMPCNGGKSRGGGKPCKGLCSEIRRQVQEPMESIPRSSERQSQRLTVTDITGEEILRQPQLRRAAHRERHRDSMQAMQRGDERGRRAMHRATTVIPSRRHAETISHITRFLLEEAAEMDKPKKETFQRQGAPPEMERRDGSSGEEAETCSTPGQKGNGENCKTAERGDGESGDGERGAEQQP